MLRGPMIRGRAPDRTPARLGAGKGARAVREADAVLRVEAADTDRYVELLASAEAAGDSDLIDELSRETKDVHSALTESLAAALETGRTLAVEPPDREKS